MHLHNLNLFALHVGPHFAHLFIGCLIMDVTGHKTRRADTDVNSDCSDNPCKNGGTCDVISGKVTCNCTLSYEKHDCRADCLWDLPGYTYAGRWHLAGTGHLKTCMPWEDIPKTRYNFTDQNFPHDGSVQAARNYCRYPAKFRKIRRALYCFVKSGASYIGLDPMLCDRLPICMPCGSYPCQNQGTCINVDRDSYLCACLIVFYGDHCETPGSSCDSHPCQNSGFCNVGLHSGAYTCECAPPYIGDTCQIDTNSSHPQPGDGVWSTWTSWVPCPAQCDGNRSSVTTRTRLCDNPSPSQGGRPCPGEADHTRACCPTMTIVEMTTSANVTPAPPAAISGNLEAIGPILPVTLSLTGIVCVLVCVGCFVAKRLSKAKDRETDDGKQVKTKKKRKMPVSKKKTKRKKKLTSSQSSI